MTFGEFFDLLLETRFPDCHSWLNVLRCRLPPALWESHCKMGLTPESAEYLGNDISGQISRQLKDGEPLARRQEILATGRAFFLAIHNMLEKQGVSVPMEVIDQIEVPPDLEE